MYVPSSIVNRVPAYVTRLHRYVENLWAYSQRLRPNRAYGKCTASVGSGELLKHSWQKRSMEQGYRHLQVNLMKETSRIS